MADAIVLDNTLDLNNQKISAVGAKANSSIIEESPKGVAEYSLQGNNLVVYMKSGDRFVIDDFVEDGVIQCDLVFVENGNSYRADFSTALSPLGDGIVDELVTVQPIGVSSSLPALLGILGAAAAVGGLALASSGDEEDQSDTPFNPTNPIDANGSESLDIPVIRGFNGELWNGSNNFADHLTNENRPTIFGTSRTPGAIVELRDADGNVLGSSIVGADGTWSVRPDIPLEDGLNNLIVVQRNDEGIESEGVSFVLDIDTIAPSAPAPVTSYLYEGDQGINPTHAEGSTNDNTPGFNVGVGLIDQPALYANGVEIGSDYDSTHGTLTPTTGLPDGTYSFTYTLTDAAGNESVQSAPFVLTIDTLAPTQTIQTASAGATRDATPVLQGTLSAELGYGESVHLVWNGVFHGVANVSGTVWTYAPGGLADGDYSYEAVVVDAAGNKGSTSATFQITVDTIAPLHPAILQMSNDMGTPGDYTTYANSTVLSGRVADAATLEVLLNGVLIGSVTIDSTGIWQSPIISLNGIAPGQTLAVSVRAIDTAGNVSTDATQIITKSVVPAGVVQIDTANLQHTQGFIIEGNINWDVYGGFVSYAGDVNGDGIGDLIVGATGGNQTGNNSGEAYVIFGSAYNFGTIDAAGRMVIDGRTLTVSQGFVIVGGGAGDNLGVSVSSAGDVNGDGIDDLIVGASNGGSAGEAYVIFGSTNGFGTLDGSGRRIIDVANLSAAQGFIIRGDVAGDNLGLSVSSAGDINGDGINDLIVGAAYGDDGGADAGEAYVIFGTTSGFGAADGSGRMVLSITNMTASQGFVIQGDETDNRFGFSVSNAGDVNGDGIADIIIGAPDGNGGGTSSGEAYVVFGSRAGFGVLDATGRRVIDVTNLSAAQGFIIQGDAANDYFGSSVSTAGDINGDGIDDLIVGARNGDDWAINAGEAYVIFGSSTGFGSVDGTGRMVIDTTTLTSAQGFILQVGVVAGSFGWSVSSAGDVNGDGIGDMIIGLPYNDNGGSFSVQAYVVFGSSGGFGSPDGAGRMVLDLTNLTSSQGFVISGGVGTDLLGVSVSSAGDLNGDGFADVIVGMQSNSDDGLGGRIEAGQAYVIFGSSEIGNADGRVVVGTSGADFLAGTSAADNMTGAGGADVLLGYEGNDTLTVNDTSFARIDGGAGHDTLILSGSGLHLDFTAIAKDIVTDIEVIDITGTGANRLTLTAQDVLDMSSTTDILIVNGNGDDTVHAAGFVDGGLDRVIGTTSYNVYTNGGATLWIDNEITNVIVA